MSFDTRGAVRLALVLAVTGGMAACSTPKKPEPPRATIATPAPSELPPQYRAPEPPRSEALPPPPTSAPLNSIPGPPAPGSAQEFVVNVGDRIYFDLNSIEIRTDAAPVLDAQAAWLTRWPQVSVRIDGNADERGTREYNFALGAQRAEAVRDYLVRRGVAANRIETVSYGKERPIAEGSDEAAYARNRNGHTTIVGGAR